jgi:lipopolysaccharide export LptBFGC system permease protein LptF
MIATLDRVMAREAVGRWLLALMLGTALVLLGDFIANMGFYLGVLASRRWWLFFAYYGCLLPGFVATWLPLSVLVSAMLAAAPMLRQGTLMALSGAGIAPARTFRPFLALGLVAGLLSFALGDQVVPRLEPAAQRLHARMKQRQHATHQARAVGWRCGGTMWTTAAALPEAGDYGLVAAFHDQPRRTLVADALHWETGAWQLRDVDLVEGDQHRRIGYCTPAEAGFALDLEAEALADRLRPDSFRTSDELAAGGSPRFREVLSGRLAWALLPLLCLLFGLPRFLRWEDRGRLAMAGAAATLLAAVPIAVAGVLGRLLVSTASRPELLTAGIMGAVLAMGALRWRRMRL